MKYFLLTLSACLIFFIVIILEAYTASQVKLAPFRNPSSFPLSFGMNHPERTYVVFGDSTAAGQGAIYEKGIAVRTATQLATRFNIQLINLGVSGAVVHDVLTKQLPKAQNLHPDIVLLSVGANDVTHLTSLESIATDLTQIITKLKAQNCAVQIILTGAPDMGTTLLFAQPLRFLAGVQATRINLPFQRVIEKQQVLMTPIAQKTGPIFAKDPSLFASDSFHPNEKGYAVWASVINETMNRSITTEKKVCH
jgi:acyl-CoA thioesterase-1